LLVNPRVVFGTGSEVAREGCLSVPEFTADVRRRSEVVVEGLTRVGKPWTLEASGFEARASSTRSTTWTGCFSSTVWSRSLATFFGARITVEVLPERCPAL